MEIRAVLRMSISEARADRDRGRRCGEVTNYHHAPFTESDVHLPASPASAAKVAASTVPFHRVSYSHGRRQLNRLACHRCKPLPVSGDFPNVERPAEAWSWRRCHKPPPLLVQRPESVCQRTGDTSRAIVNASMVATLGMPAPVSVDLTVVSVSPAARASAPMVNPRGWLLDAAPPLRRTSMSPSLKPTQLPFQLALLRATEFAPVSYTHLTLPTTREV